MMNLYHETLKEMEYDGKTIDDIDYITTKHFWIPVERMQKLFDGEYDNGYGGPEIDTCLTIVFKDGTWLERWEYDGSEGWRYAHKPAKADVEIQPHQTIGIDPAD